MGNTLKYMETSCSKWRIFTVESQVKMCRLWSTLKSPRVLRHQTARSFAESSDILRRSSSKQGKAPVKCPKSRGLDIDRGKSSEFCMSYWDSEALPEVEKGWKHKLQRNVSYGRHLLLFLCIRLLSSESCAAECRKTWCLQEPFAKFVSKQVLVFTLHHMSCLCKNQLTPWDTDLTRRLSDILRARRTPRPQIDFEPSWPGASNIWQKETPQHRSPIPAQHMVRA